MVSARTLMSAEKVYVPMEGAGTRLDHLIANVQLDFTSQLMENNALTTMNASKQECVPMEFVPTWMGLSSVTIMKVSNFPFLAFPVLMSMNAKKIP